MTEREHFAQWIEKRCLSLRFRARPCALSTHEEIVAASLQLSCSWSWAGRLKVRGRRQRGDSCSVATSSFFSERDGKQKKMLNSKEWSATTLTRVQTHILKVFSCTCFLPFRLVWTATSQPRMLLFSPRDRCSGAARSCSFDFISLNDKSIGRVLEYEYPTI